MKIPPPVTLDVRNLLASGIDPYPEIKRCVDTLVPGQAFTVITPFLPAPLIERLKGAGYSTKPVHQSDGSWQTRFVRPASGAAESAL